MPAINAERLLATFLELVQIDSPTGKEAAVAAYCKRALEEAGCKVRIDDSQEVTGSNTGNLIATLAASEGPFCGPSEALFFSAHMDSVNPCLGIKPLITNGVIHTDGTTVLGGDDKVGIAAILELIRCLAEGASAGEPHPEIRVLFTVAEETGLLGAKALNKAEFLNSQGAFCYVLDAAGLPGLVVNGAPYQYSYRAEYRGLASHAGIAPEAGISAIRAAAQAIAALPQGRIGEESTTNVGLISGGTANNVVAGECVVTGELRSHCADQIKILRSEITEILTTAGKDDGTGAGLAEVCVQWELDYEGFFAPDDSPEVQLALRAAEELSLPALTEKSNGGADTNVLVSYGLAAVSLGSGMERVHSAAECLAVSSLENLARLVLRIVRISQTEV
ncbi:MAG: M20/M25/M40 family metallo-hydrolase [Coriobacteriales bacterium]|jgi:tripeptide aminopeptidase|nr:M20/M25/M40 family metallo-hydrolase [Coriobacteriales bacterium]